MFKSVLALLISKTTAEPVILEQGTLNVPPMPIALSDGIAFDMLENPFYILSADVANAMIELNLTEVKATIAVVAEYFRPLVEAKFSDEALQSLPGILRESIKTAKINIAKMEQGDDYDASLVPTAQAMGAYGSLAMTSGCLLPEDLRDVAIERPSLLFVECVSCARHPEFLQDIDISFNIANEFLNKAIEAIQSEIGDVTPEEVFNVLFQRAVTESGITSDALELFILAAQTPEALASLTITTLSNHLSFKDYKKVPKSSTASIEETTSTESSTKKASKIDYADIVIAGLARGFQAFEGGDYSSVAEHLESFNLFDGVTEEL